MNVLFKCRYDDVIEEICSLKWRSLTREELSLVALSYYFFSVQFRESLELAVKLYPGDRALLELQRGECNTDNLSPYPEVAGLGERMNHDEFMLRTIALSDIGLIEAPRIERLGQIYLMEIQKLSESARALSIASYEDGGLERVFRNMLQAPDWHDRSLQAFRHFLIRHISFDSDVDAGHGALCKHLAPDDQVLPLWQAFLSLLVQAVPALQ